MNKKFSIREPIESDVEYLAKHIRKEDNLEITALGFTAEEAFRLPIKNNSGNVWTADYNGVPMCMCGIYKDVILSDIATIWMLGTSDLKYCSRELITVTKELISYGLLDNSQLINYVDYRYKKSLRWLKHLGFSISAPERIGVNGEKFVKISISR